MFKGVFTGSLRNAIALNAEQYYWDSHKENVFCKKLIEWMILNRFEDGHLRYDCAYDLCNMFGFERVAWVVANTIQLTLDPTIGKGNQMWAFEYLIPSEDEDLTEEFCVLASGQAIGDLAWQLRTYCIEQEVLEYTACIPEDTYSDYTDKLLIIAPGSLKDMYRTEKYQYFYVENYERDPSNGMARIEGVYLVDGMTATLNDCNVLGVADEDCLPQWVYEKLDECRKVMKEPNED